VSPNIDRSIFTLRS